MRFLAALSLLTGSLSIHATALNTTSTSSTAQVLPHGFEPPQTFKNTNLVRNVNLEKGYARESVNVVIENTSKSPQSEYYIPFATDVIDKVGGLEVWEKDAANKNKFALSSTEFLSSSPNQFFIAHLPKPLEPSSRLTLTISYYLLSSLTPLPAAIEQDAKQYLTYSFSAYVLSAYTTESQKTKVKFPSTSVPDYTKTSGLKSGEDPERQGSIYTYGPYKTTTVNPGTIEPITVRYEFTKPIVACSLLERDVEVSHWGGNLATEDRYWLRNDGARLTKQFDRVSWAMKQYQKVPSVAMNNIRMLLTPGSMDPYFIDDIGNVTTSRYRPGTRTQPGLLDLRPRYPVFGDWKYSFKVGWNNALSSFLRKTTSDNGEGYVLKIPFLAGPKMAEGIQYEKVQLRVVLPEGADNVKFEIVDGAGMPYKIDSELSLHKSFMDTVGRTVLKLTTTNLSDEAREGHLIVAYDYPFLAGFRKPLTIFAAILSVFTATWLIGNIDVSIKKR